MRGLWYTYHGSRLHYSNRQGVNMHKDIKETYYKLNLIVDKALAEGQIENYIRFDQIAADFAAENHKEIFGREPTILENIESEENEKTINDYSLSDFR